MTQRDEEGALHIHLSGSAENVLDVFNRAQAGELEPLAKYIEDGKPLTHDMRLFLAALLRGKLRWPANRKKSLDKILMRSERLYLVEQLRKTENISKEEAISRLAEELNISYDTLYDQVRDAKKEAKGPFRIGPAYDSED